MRHRVQGKKLNRSPKHRKALFKNLAAALITNGQITTTQTKAKAIQRITDKLISRAKKNNLHSRRLLFSFFNDKDVTNILVDKVAPQMSARTSGYTRVTDLGRRRGDDSMMSRISFVDTVVYAEPAAQDKKSEKKASK